MAFIWLMYQPLPQDSGQSRPASGLTRKRTSLQWGRCRAPGEPSSVLPQQLTGLTQAAHGALGYLQAVACAGPAGGGQVCIDPVKACSGVTVERKTP